MKVMNILNWEPPFGEKGVDVGGQLVQVCHHFSLGVDFFQSTPATSLKTDPLPKQTHPNNDVKIRKILKLRHPNL